MDTLLFTLAFFGAAILIMSVGVLFKRKPIQGSCGGIANFMGSCDICEKKSECIDKIKLNSDCSTKNCSTEDQCN
jgi:uncharacterized protein